MPYKYEVYRKLIHLSSIWIVFAIYFLSKIQVLFLVSSLFFILSIFEFFRHSTFNDASIIEQYLNRVLRPHEKTNAQTKKLKLTGAFYFMLAVVLSVALFDKYVAMTALTVMIVSDTVAALVGRKLGQTKIWGKTVEGSMAFFVTTVIILYNAQVLGVNLLLANIALISLLVTLVEFSSNKIKIDDNLSIALITATLLTWL